MSEKGVTSAGLKLANAFVLTTRGVPQLYYGDEIAMTGPDEPTTRGDFPGGFPGDKRDAFTPAGLHSKSVPTDFSVQPRCSLCLCGKSLP